MKKNIRPLLIAEAANPEWVSVPLIGWSLARAIQKETDAHIVTQIRNRDAFLRAGLTEGKDFTAIDTEALAAPAFKLAQVLRMGENRGWTMVSAIQSLTYPFFERKLWHLFGDRIRACEFDLVHRITPLSPTATSPIAGWCKQHHIPFVAGPINGGVAWPPGFSKERLSEREWLSYVRSAYKYLPGRGKSLNSSSAIIAGSHSTRAELPQAILPRTVYIPENAVDTDRFNKTTSPSDKLPLRACFVGRFVPYKGPDMVVEAALPLLSKGRLTLDMIGDGPMLERLKSLAASQGVSDQISFHGWLEHKSVQNIMSKCSVLAFPSVREFGGGVVLEAMALGVVPVVVDYAGPSELVTDKTGYRLPLGNREEIIEALRNQLTELCDKPQILHEVSRAAVDRVEKLYTWTAKARQVLSVYEWVLSPAGDKPTFEF